MTTPITTRPGASAHRAAGLLAFATVVSFLSSTIVVELLGDHEAILAVKRGIVLGMFVLIPSMAFAARSGSRLAAKVPGEIERRKLRRRKLIAGNGLLVLAPSAITLWRLAEAGRFGVTFALVQSLELLAGTTNAVLMARMIWDGMQLSGRIARTQPTQSAPR